MIFSVFNDGIEWSLDFKPDSVVVTVRDLFHARAITSLESPLSAWSLPLSQETNFCASSKNPQSAKDYGDAGWFTFNCRRTRHGNKRVSGVWSGRYGVSLGWSWLELGRSFPTRHSNSLLPINIYRFRERFNRWKPDSGDKESSPPLLTTPVPERPNQHPVLIRSCPFGSRTEKVPDYVNRNLFE